MNEKYYEFIFADDLMAGSANGTHTLQKSPNHSRPVCSGYTSEA